jgi:branched-chain amino acid transport system substrate-binding protein
MERKDPACPENLHGPKRAMKLFHFAAGILFFSLFVAAGAPAAAAGEPPIRIGATVSLKGPYKEPSLMVRHSFRLWAHEVNQAGGLLGRPVELILYDDKSSKERAKRLYQRLIRRDQVDLVFSPYGTPLTLEASAVSEKHRMLMLACAASGKILWQRGFRFLFGVYALAERYFIGILDLMARQGIRSVSLVYDTGSPFTIEVAEGAKEWARKFNMNIVDEMPYENGAAALPDVVSGLTAGKARQILLSAYPPDCYRFMEALAKLGFRPRVLGMTIAPVHPQFRQKAGPAAEGVFAPSQWEANERIPFPGTREFVAAFRRFTGKAPSYHAGAAYAACQLYEEAIQETGTLDNEKLRSYIANLDTVTVIGRFKAGASGAQIGHNPIIIQWQEGKKEIVWPVEMQTAPPLFFGADAE